MAKRTTGRSFLGRSCNIVNSFTIESSFGVMTDKERKVVLLDRVGFAKVGEDIGKGVEYWLRVTEEK